LKIASLAFSMALLAPAPAARAHHGWSEFDLGRQITMTGTVVDFHFVNPHCVVEFDSTDAVGRHREWQGEFSSPGQLARKGWNAALLQPGDTITLTGHPAKNAAAAIYVQKIRMADGKEFVVEGR
jgi:hypothetical protein